MNGRIVSIILLCVLGWGFGRESRAAELVYDNSQNPFNQYWGTDKEFGDEITLEGEADELVITRFRFETFIEEVLPDATAVLRFYENNGGFSGLDQQPGDLLFESVRFSLGQGVTGLTLEEVTVPVPRNFTWTIEFSGVTTGDSGLTLYNPVAVGESDNFLWIRDPEDGWQLTRFAGGGIPVNFGAQVYAEAEPPPEDELSIELAVSDSLLTLRGTSYQVYQIQRSSDLRQWKTIATEVSRTGTIRIRDSRLADEERVFYRAVQP